MCNTCSSPLSRCCPVCTDCCMTVSNYRRAFSSYSSVWEENRLLCSLFIISIQVMFWGSCWRLWIWRDVYALNDSTCLSSNNTRSVYDNHFSVGVIVVFEKPAISFPCNLLEKKFPQNDCPGGLKKYLGYIFPETDYKVLFSLWFYKHRYSLCKKWSLLSMEF